MSLYHIDGKTKYAGYKTSVVIDAKNKKDAKLQANNKNVSVRKIMPLPSIVSDEKIKRQSKFGWNWLIDAFITRESETPKERKDYKGEKNVELICWIVGIFFWPVLLFAMSLSISRWWRCRENKKDKQIRDLIEATKSNKNI